MAMAICSSALRVVCAARAPKVKAAGAGNVVTAGKKFANLGEAVDAGLVKGCAPFEGGIDAFGFFNGIDESEAQRYADVEITHGRLAMLASLGFLVGEQVEGSSFLFDAQVTGPAVNHFQQVPETFWVLIGAFIFLVETARVQTAWQDPFQADRLFLQKETHIPGDYNFDPLKLGAKQTEDKLEDRKMRELNNGRLAMVSITAMVAQELVTGLNLILSDEALEQGSLSAMETACSGKVDEALCSKAYEAAIVAGTTANFTF